MSLHERLALFGQKSLETGGLVAGGATIVGSLLGVLKNMLLASRFGAGAELDVYFAAFRVPDLLYGVFVFSALAGPFVSVFSRTVLEGKERAWKLASAFMAFFAVLLGIGAVTVFFLAKPVAQLLAPGFSAMQIDLLSSLLRILMIQPMLMALGGLLSDVLQSFKRFFAATLAPVFYNGGIIAGIVLFSQHTGVYGVVWGGIAGSLLYALMQLASMRGVGFRFLLALGEMRDSMREVLALMVPRSITLIANNAILIWVTMISSLLPIGSLSIYSFVDSLQSVPQAVIALSFVTVAFPQLTQQWAKSAQSNDDLSREGEKAKFVRLFDAAGGQIMAWLVPCSFLLAAFSGPIVRVLLGHGNFNAADQHTAVLALMIFALGVPAQGLLMHMIRTFFAMEDAKHPLFAAFLSLLIILPSVWFGALHWGVFGIIAGIVLGAWFNAAYLVWLFTKLLGTGYLPRLRYGISRGAALGFVSATAGTLVYYGSGLVVPSADFMIVLLRTVVAGSVSVLALGFAIFIYKVMDLSKFLEQEESLPTAQ